MSLVIIIIAALFNIFIHFPTHFNLFSFDNVSFHLYTNLLFIMVIHLIILTLIELICFVLISHPPPIIQNYIKVGLIAFLFISTYNFKSNDYLTNLRLCLQIHVIEEFSFLNCNFPLAIL